MEEKIIEFVRDNPALWDKHDSGYKNSKLKDKKWNKISAMLGISEEAAKKRWKTIRDRYYRILKLGDTTLASGQSTITKYKYADMLEFLRGNKTHYKSSLNNFSEEDSNSNTNCNEILIEHCLKYEYIDAIEESQNENNDNCSTMEPLENSFQDDPIRQTKTNKRPSDTQQWQEVIESKQPSNVNNSPAHLFMMSLALQIEKANLSTESFLNLQIKMLKLVKEEIKQQK